MKQGFIHQIARRLKSGTPLPHRKRHMLRNITLGTRLSLGYALLIVLMIGLAWFSVDRVNFVERSLSVMNDVNSVKQRYAINFRGSVHDRAISLRDVVLVDSNSEMDAAIADIDRLAKNYIESAGPLDALFAAGTGVTPDEQRILTSIKEIENQTLPFVGRVIELRKSGANEAARELLMAEARPAFSEWLKRINQFIDLQEAKNAAIASSAGAVVASFQWTTILLCVGAIAIGTGVAFWSLLSIKPLRKLTDLMGAMASGNYAQEVPFTERGDEVGSIARAVEVFKQAASENERLDAEAAKARAEQTAQTDRQAAIESAKAADLKTFVIAVEKGFNGLSEGDLTVRINDAVAPEFEPIRAKFNDSVTQLENTIGQVVTSMGSIRTGLGEIASAAGDLSQRTEQQAASLEETVAALGEVTRAVNETAEGAGQAQRAAHTTQTNAEKGGEIVGHAIEAMNQIESSSEKIGRIIGVIDEIAFQTNLLALNAGVEAARAGEAGKGFAVVAQEVRGLAQRSAEAAKEIKELISMSSQQVGKGVELVTASGKSLEEIVSQVAEMNRLVSNIARSANEQAVSLKEVTTAADQMDKVTQQNAAMVEQTTASAQTVSAETQEMATIVARFKTNVAQSRSRPAKQTASRGVPGSSKSRSTPVTQMRTTSSAMPSQDGWAEF
ncbi:MAG TPA: methyl-accepting chemotaxis protein [Aurantimonas sp.]